MTTPTFDPTTQKNISLWLDGLYDEQSKQEVRDLIKTNPQEAIDAFYTNLSFGTGGMRSVMGVGCNRMNVYTVRAATQGLANYIMKQPKSLQGYSAFIGYDSRHHSRSFAEEATKVLAANGIKVYLCKEIRPTPLVSYGCRLKKCITAIMITASHNPPEYNGYKVYWDDGAQVLPPHDTGIIDEVVKITDPSMVKVVDSLNHPLIEFVAEEIDEPYWNEGSHLQYFPKENQEFGKELKIVYTSLHGTGITLMPEMMKRWGFTNVSFVDKQIIPDGDFPTAHSPNPEEKAALELGIQKLQATDSDILIATDPDADRVGTAVMHQGKAVLINGNQMACICLEHVCETLTQLKKMPENAAFIKTIVTTELFKAICDGYQKKCFNVLTGFKYIAEKIREWESTPHGYQYIFGGEESYGYLFGTITRDKDAIISSNLICQAALQAKLKGKTLIDYLHDIYRKYGIYYEGLLSIKFEESMAGKEEMNQAMETLRNHLPTKIKEIEIITVEDYKSLTKTTLKTGDKEKIDLPESDVLVFWLSDQSKLMVRPSGTEPKVKVYCGVIDKKTEDIDAGMLRCQDKAKELLAAMQNLLKSKN